MTIIPEAELRGGAKPPVLPGIPKPVGTGRYSLPTQCIDSDSVIHATNRVCYMSPLNITKTAGMMKPTFSGAWRWWYPDQPTQSTLIPCCEPRYFSLSVSELRVHATKCPRSRTAKWRKSVEMWRFWKVLGKELIEKSSCFGWHLIGMF